MHGAQAYKHFQYDMQKIGNLSWNYKQCWHAVCSSPIYLQHQCNKGGFTLLDFFSFFLILLLFFMCLFFESLFQSDSKNRSKALNDTLPHKFGAFVSNPLRFGPNFLWLCCLCCCSNVYTAQTQNGRGRSRKFFRCKAVTRRIISWGGKLRYHQSTKYLCFRGFFGMSMISNVVSLFKVWVGYTPMTLPLLLVVSYITFLMNSSRFVPIKSSYISCTDIRWNKGLVFQAFFGLLKYQHLTRAASLSKFMSYLSIYSVRLYLHTFHWLNPKQH